ncbi:MAG: beta-ketoacyl-ACP synthase II [Candidatus Dormibacteraeota bacterium]|nr:beta-ketoacyl-ACP synthase II [Candidatus Dormibacteraeota bacterium]
MADGERVRVVVTGLGMVTPLGNDVANTWHAVRSGRSGVGPITRFDASRFTSRIAGEVKNYDAAAEIGSKEARRSARPIHLAMSAARQAVTDSGLDVGSMAADVGVCIGSGVGGLEILERATRVVDSSGPQRVSPFAAAASLIDMAPGMVAIDVGARGPNIAVVSACASGADAIGQAAEWIRRGDATAVLAGGTESAITETGLAIFAAARALSTRNDQPQAASRPFDRDRDGFVTAEGSAVLVLEERKHALARGAHVYGEVAGYSATADAHHITAPDPTGAGAVLCMRRAIGRAGLEPSAIGYVNAHGTGTALNDLAETRALKCVFSDHAQTIPVSSTKSMTGHLLGAAGAFEAAVTLLAMRDGFIPPTINLDNPDPECDLDYVPHVGRSARLHHAMSTSFGFGGHNACLVFSADQQRQPTVADDQ